MELLRFTPTPKMFVGTLVYPPLGLSARQVAEAASDRLCRYLCLEAEGGKDVELPIIAHERPRYF